MAHWSAENATKAYLSTLKMDQKAKEPAIAEYISTLAADNNAQLKVVACAGSADSTTLALIATANQTNGNVICIIPNNEDLIASQQFLGVAANQVKFMIGKEVHELSVLNQADFVVIDCNLVNHKEIVELVQIGGGNKQKGIVVVGYNALSCKGSWKSYGSKTKMLPIGEGLSVTRFRGNAIGPNFGSRTSKSARSRWFVKVNKCTGEEHVYIIRLPQGKVI